MVSKVSYADIDYREKKQIIKIFFTLMQVLTLNNMAFDYLLVLLLHYYCLNSQSITAKIATVTFYSKLDLVIVEWDRQRKHVGGEMRECHVTQPYRALLRKRAQTRTIQSQIAYLSPG
jgi:hypothetical protein